MDQLSPARIHIVEDDVSYAEILREMLESAGYIVSISESGEEAISIIPQVSADLVLMDILLSTQMDGVTAAEEIRKKHRIPVIFITGYADPTTIQRAKFAKPYGLLVKPVERKQLHASIEIAMQKHKVEQQERRGRSWAVSALQHMADAVIITDELGLVRFMNEPAENLTGWKLQEAEGEQWGIIFRTMREIPQSLLDASILTDSMTAGVGEYAMLLQKDGNSLMIDYSLAPLHGDMTKTAGYVIVFRDVTERNLLERALGESRRRYRDLVNSVDGTVWESEGENHRFTFVSKQAKDMLGFPLEDWTTQEHFWQDHLHPNDRDWVVQFVKNARPPEMSDYQIEYRMITAAGEELWVRDMFHADFDEQHPSRFRGVLLNITEGKETERALRTSHDVLERRVQERTAELTRVVAALRESEERYSLAVTGANDGLWDWNLKSNEIYFAPRWKSMLGYSDEEIGTKPLEWLNRIHAEDIERVKADLTAHLEGSKPQFQSECRMIHKDGSYRWILSRGVAVRDELGPYRLAGSQTDITERKLAEEQLLKDAFYDPLTGLPNRALFLDRLAGATARTAARARRGKLQYFAVLFMDLDRFKVVNDSLGHLIGDELLIGFAQRLQSCIRPGDTIARLGGDEFTLLVEDVIDVRDAVGVADRILSSLKQPFYLGGREIFTTASIGIAMSSMTPAAGTDLLRDADAAMYFAKTRGKARYEIFDSSMHGRALALLQLETDLRRAVERKEFRIYYQPVVSLSVGRVQGFEALMRWQHPERGMLLPEELIPLAEETGLIIPIGYGVLRDACRQMRIWREHYNMDNFLSVNISAKQFAEPNLVNDLHAILEETGFLPEHLELEITESIIMQDIEFASSLLQKLKDLKVRLLIDDFGTGYSSLSYLQKFPIDTLKIDRSFIGTEEKADSWEIVRAIISLARSLKMDVIAEGVETEYQRSHLLSLGCERGQGFLFARPMEAENVYDYWRSTMTKPDADSDNVAGL